MRIFLPFFLDGRCGRHAAQKSNGGTLAIRFVIDLSPQGSVLECGSVEAKLILGAFSRGSEQRNDEQ